MSAETFPSVPVYEASEVPASQQQYAEGEEDLSTKTKGMPQQQPNTTYISGLGSPDAGDWYDF